MRTRDIKYLHNLKNIYLILNNTLVTIRLEEFGLLKLIIGIL